MGKTFLCRQNIMFMRHNSFDIGDEGCPAAKEHCKMDISIKNSTFCVCNHTPANIAALNRRKGTSDPTTPLP